MLAKSFYTYIPDFPHPEGLAEPVSFREEIAHLPGSEQSLIMSANGRRLVGLA